MATLRELANKYGKKYGISPSLILSIMSQESMGNVNAVSPKNASGLMQLMPATAKALGVKDIFDIEQNVDAGAKYLAQQLKTNKGDVGLALAAYNAGPGAVRKYGGIPPYNETIKYVDNILYNRLPQAQLAMRGAPYKRGAQGLADIDKEISQSSQSSVSKTSSVLDTLSATPSKAESALTYKGGVAQSSVPFPDVGLRDPNATQAVEKARKNSADFYNQLTQLLNNPAATANLDKQYQDSLQAMRTNYEQTSKLLSAGNAELRAESVRGNTQTQGLLNRYNQDPANALSRSAQNAQDISDLEAGLSATLREKRRVANMSFFDDPGGYITTQLLGNPYEKGAASIEADLRRLREANTAMTGTINDQRALLTSATGTPESVIQSDINSQLRLAQMKQDIDLYTAKSLTDIANAKTADYDLRVRAAQQGLASAQSLIGLEQAAQNLLAGTDPLSLAADASTRRNVIDSNEDKAQFRAGANAVYAPSNAGADTSFISQQKAQQDASKLLNENSANYGGLTGLINANTARDTLGKQAYAATQVPILQGTETAKNLADYTQAQANSKITLEDYAAKLALDRLTTANSTDAGLNIARNAGNAASTADNIARNAAFNSQQTVLNQETAAKVATQELENKLFDEGVLGLRTMEDAKISRERAQAFEASKAKDAEFNERMRPQREAIAKAQAEYDILKLQNDTAAAKGEQVNVVEEARLKRELQTQQLTLQASELEYNKQRLSHAKQVLEAETASKQAEKNDEKAFRELVSAGALAIGKSDPVVFEAYTPESLRLLTQFAGVGTKDANGVRKVVGMSPVTAGASMHALGLLVNNPRYPNMQRTYEKSLALAKAVPSKGADKPNVANVTQNQIQDMADKMGYASKEVRDLEFNNAKSMNVYGLPTRLEMKAWYDANATNYNPNVQRILDIQGEIDFDAKGADVEDMVRAVMDAGMKAPEAAAALSAYFMATIDYNNDTNGYSLLGLKDASVANFDTLRYGRKINLTNPADVLLTLGSYTRYFR